MHAGSTVFDFCCKLVYARRPKHPSSREKMIKLDVEAYLGPNATAFIMTEGA